MERLDQLFGRGRKNSTTHGAVQGERERETTHLAAERERERDVEGRAARERGERRLDPPMKERNKIAKMQK